MRNAREEGWRVIAMYTKSLENSTRGRIRRRNELCSEKAFSRYVPKRHFHTLNYNHDIGLLSIAAARCSPES